MNNTDMRQRAQCVIDLAGALVAVDRIIAREEKRQRRIKISIGILSVTLFALLFAIFAMLSGCGGGIDTPDEVQPTTGLAASDKPCPVGPCQPPPFRDPATGGGP